MTFVYGATISERLQERRMIAVGQGKFLPALRTYSVSGAEQTADWYPRHHLSASQSHSQPTSQLGTKTFLFRTGFSYRSVPQRPGRRQRADAARTGRGSEPTRHAGVFVGNLSPNNMTRSLCVRGDRFRVKMRSILLRRNTDYRAFGDIIIRGCGPPVLNGWGKKPTVMVLGPSTVTGNFVFIVHFTCGKKHKNAFSQ